MATPVAGRVVPPGHTRRHRERHLLAHLGFNPVVPLTDTVNAVVLYNGEQAATLWTRGATLRFTMTEPGAGAAGRPPNVRIVDGDDGHTWLVISNQMRNLAWEWAWNLDALCAGATPTTTTGA